jgi:hypothetical protein
MSWKFTSSGLQYLSGFHVVLELHRPPVTTTQFFIVKNRTLVPAKSYWSYTYNRTPLSISIIIQHIAKVRLAVLPKKDTHEYSVSRFRPQPYYLYVQQLLLIR